MTKALLGLLLAGGLMPLGAVEIAVSWGVGPGNKTSVSTPAGTVSTVDRRTLLFDTAHKIVGIGPASLAWDVPLTFGAPGKADTYGTSSNGSAYAERMDMGITPGLKLRLGLGMLSPWVSFGAGFARLSRTGAEYAGTSVQFRSSDSWAFAVSPAGGVDFRPIPILFLRGEVRSFTFKSPGAIFTGLGALEANWRNNLLFLGGIGARF